MTTLLHRLGQLGTGIVLAARQGTGVDGFNNPAFRMSADEVRNIALQMLQNPLLRSVIQVDPDAQSAQLHIQQNSANRAIYDIHAQGQKKRGGRRTRKHKKRRKKTRHRRKRGKKTRHKKKKRTRKH